MRIPSDNEIISSESKKILKVLLDHFNETPPIQRKEFQTATNLFDFDSWMQDIALHEALDLLKERGYIKSIKTIAVTREYDTSPSQFTRIQEQRYPEEILEELESQKANSGHFISDMIEVSIKYDSSKILELLERIKSDKKLKRVTLEISAEEGVSRKFKGNTLVYPVKANRLEIITRLKNGKQSGKELARLYNGNLSDLSRSISEINEIFRDKLNLDEDLIQRAGTGGYKLNKKNYSIKFIGI